MKTILLVIGVLAAIISFAWVAKQPASTKGDREPVAARYAHSDKVDDATATLMLFTRECNSSGIRDLIPADAKRKAQAYYESYRAEVNAKMSRILNMISSSRHGRETAMAFWCLDTQLAVQGELHVIGLPDHIGQGRSGR